VTAQLSLFACDKRWEQRRERWVTPDNPFKPHGYAVDVVGESLARTFVTAEHYSGSFPAARISIGLWGPGPALAGVAVFSVPMSEAVLQRWLGTDGSEGVELGRFVCGASVRFNGETWFLKRAFAALRREKNLRSVLSCADPLERRTIEGALTKTAHYGTIYKAKGALFAGRTASRWVVLAPDGSIVSERMLSKIRQNECGSRYAIRRLVEYGAEPRRPMETWSDWVARITRLPPFRRIKHPGNYAYVFGLDDPARDQLAALHDGGLPYPAQRHAGAQRA
jgi:hypothetical protein